MKRITSVILGFAVALLAVLSIAAQPPKETGTGSAAPSRDAEVQTILQKYTEIFNKHDAKAVAELWAPQAVSVDTATGRRVVGREAIQTDFQDSFKAAPKSKLSLQLKNHRFIKPDVLSITGEGTVSGTAGDESNSFNFTALLIKQGEHWLIEEATESPLATPATPYDGLKDLEWMVGSWQDDMQDLTVTTEVKWNSAKTLLLRKYVIESKDSEANQSGMQIIAWDPRSRGIRSWTFCADGSFGEASWVQHASEWRVKYHHTSVDGSLENGMQLINKIDNNSGTVQLIGQEIDGEPQPNGPTVKMVRK